MAESLKSYKKKKKDEEEEAVKDLISTFHRALLQSITFISQLMHSIIQILEVKIYIA